MNRRITIAILATVAAALVLAGLGTLVLTRFGARQAAEDDLRHQAEAVSDLIALGQQASLLSPDNRAAITEWVCSTDPDPAPTGRAREGLDRLRALVCPSADLGSGTDDARQQLCGSDDRRLDSVLPAEVAEARHRYCASPTDANLTALRQSYCRSDTPSHVNAAAQRRVARLRRAFCLAGRTPSTSGEEPNSELQTTLSRQAIELVMITPDNQLASGSTLPEGLTPAELKPETLREGQTVSASYAPDRLFAASAVNPDSDDLWVVLVEGPADNVARRAVPWFLAASGVTLLVGAAVAWALSRRLTEPLREATAVTARIAGGDLSSRLPEHLSPAGEPRDELDTLSHSINAMADSLERSRILEQQFLLSVSHDLRTPLTSIRGYAEAVADGAAPEPAEAARVILAESRRLERLVGDLLDLATLEAHHFSLTLEAVDLGAVARTSVESFQREAVAAGVELELGEPPSPVRVVADSGRLQQVIANLVENALKFATTRIAVTVDADDTGPRLRIADDGPGIAPEDLPHVFERLYVANASPVRKEAGSGLGLAIVHELVGAMGGTVTATAHHPGGTVMVVRLPAAPD